jgi:hypothetical protein
MATLQGQQIADTYQSLIKTCDNNNVTGSIQLSDGDGCLTSLCINTAGNGIVVGGNSTFANDLNVQGNLTVTGNASVEDLTIIGNDICDSTGAIKVNFAAAGTTICSNTVIGGALSATGDIIAFCTSDRRLKDNLQQINNSQIIVNSLTGYNFEWNSKTARTGQDVGIMAQDLQNILPLAVQERVDGNLAVDYVKLIPVLIEEVKRLNNEINELKNTINN